MTRFSTFFVPFLSTLFALSNNASIIKHISDASTTNAFATDSLAVVALVFAAFVVLIFLAFSSHQFDGFKSISRQSLTLANFQHTWICLYYCQHLNNVIFICVSCYRVIAVYEAKPRGRNLLLKVANFSRSHKNWRFMLKFESVLWFLFNVKLRFYSFPATSIFVVTANHLNCPLA